MYVTHQGGTEFHVIFGHAAPPLLIGKEEHELPDFISIQPVAKIVLSVDGMRLFVKALNDNLAKFDEMKKGCEGE